MLHCHERSCALFAGLLSCLCLLPASAQPPRFDRWEKAVAAFEKQDQVKPPPKNAVLFVGSSSIVGWKLNKHFPDLETINRGFGGSRLIDSVHFAPRLILKHEPRIVVLYAGDNDLASSKTPEQLREDFRAFVEVLRAKLPNVRIIFISLKPSPSRIRLLEKQRQANQLIEEYCRKEKGLVYLDIFQPMLNAEGQPRPELFGKDQLHMNEEGYKLWTERLKPHLK